MQESPNERKNLYKKEKKLEDLNIIFALNIIRLGHTVAAEEETQHAYVIKNGTILCLLNEVFLQIF